MQRGTADEAVAAVDAVADDERAVVYIQGLDGVRVEQLYGGAICRTAEREGGVGEGAAIYSVETAFVFAAPEGVCAV
jgi:hypothetical protein